MRYLLQLARYFFKKNIKSIISFSIILLVATIMFSSGLTINLNIDDAYDKRFDELNTANVTFTIPSVLYNDSLISDVKNLDSVSDAVALSGIVLNVPIEMNDSVQEQNQIFYKMSEVLNISKYNIYKSVSNEMENGIYVPYYIYTNSNIDFKYEFKDYSFNVKGIIEEMQYGNYSSSLIGLYLDDDAYDYLLKNNKMNEAKTIMIKSDDSKSSYNEVSKLFAENNIQVINKGYDQAKKQSRLSMSNILVLILLAFSTIILAISLLVTKFKIKQTIEEDLTNMGVLKSIGYKSKEIIIGMILPYLIVTLLVSIIGILLSIPVIGVLGHIISGQAGFVWVPEFSLGVSIMTVILNLILVVLFSYMSSRRIKNLNPIEAIRGISKASKNKNYFEIKDTRGNINVILALKNFANSISSNILLGMVLLFITLLVSFVGILFYNVNVNPMNFINTLVEEHPTIMIKQKSDIKDEIKKIDGIKKVVYYDENGEVALKSNSYKTFISESFNDLANDLVYEGKNPSKAFEVAVGSSIKEEFDYKLGDKIKLSKNGVSKEYEIVGFVQSVNYSGEIIELTLDGYRLMDSDYKPSYLYIYAFDETEDVASSLIKEIEGKYKDKIDTTVNYVESMNSASVMFLNLIKTITIIIIVITLMIVYLILNILISGIIQNKKQELGVLKSIGYKTSNLIFQIVGGLVPSTIIFIVLGLIMSKLFMCNIFNFIFKMVGAYKVSFEYPLFIFILISMLLIISTILIGVLLCRKIKKVTIYSLIKD